MAEYYIPAQDSETEFSEKRSRFIGHVWHVETEEEAREKIAEMKAKYYDARHNCWCYLIREGGITRYSDDGEPQGTAGQPMLEVFRREGVENVCCVVTRYFGGILLGAGGLVRAYSHTCALALNAAKVCEMHPTVRYMAEVAYPLWDRVQHQLKSLPVRLENPEFTAAVGFELVMKEADEARVREELTRVTDGRMEWLKTEETYSPWEEENSDGLV